jgi:thiamine biosynthesis lipoprotein
MAVRANKIRQTKHFVIVLILLALPAGLPAHGEMLRLESSRDAMGATYSVVLYGPDRERLETAAEDAFDEVRRLDDELSNYKPSSEWSQVNRFAAERPVPVSPELFGLLSDCLEYSRQSEGAFDITVGPLMKVWGFYKGSGHLPKPEEVKTALMAVGYKNIVLDPANRTVRFKRPGVEMDPGGIGKGFAVDKMADVLRKEGIQIALVSGSGSSIYAIGAPPGEKGWTISIRDPRDETKTVQDIVLKDESLSTSGSYEKFFEADGKIYAHIMDPRTGYPAQGMLSVSIITPKTLDSEAWCKPFFINGRKWASQHKPKGVRAFFCEDRPEPSCVWLQ